MSKFSVIPKGGGNPKYTGAPTFTGTYMKPGMLEFREVAVPAPIDWEAGDYVVYSRTGRTYRLYGIPQMKKQARRNTYGGAFVYQGVQFFDDSKQLEICPFRDLVAGDNRIHFSTQPSISTFEPVDGIALRLQACLEDMYGAGSWVVRVATESENPGIYPLVSEAREFNVSGVNLIEALDKVYEVWPEVGWVYKVEGGVNTIVIGGGGISSTSSFLYGKGNGLTSITRTVANADEMANRIFAYGSMQNMLPRWYNGQDIKDAESVDIQNLMLPVNPIASMDWSGWGMTSGERDAAKAFVEDASSIQKNGLRPATVYFDGKGEYPEIYPSLRETTIGMVRTAIGDSTAKYYPSTAIYADPSARVDEILSAPSSFDSGLAGANGKSSIANDSGVVNENGNKTIPAGGSETVLLYEGTLDAIAASKLELKASASLSGEVGSSASSASVEMTMYGYVGELPYIAKKTSIPLEQVGGEWQVVGGNDKLNILGAASGDRHTLKVELVMFNSSVVAVSCAYFVNGGVSFEESMYRERTFSISIRQVGFDIGAQAALGDGKTIAMRTGKCAGRSFVIKSVQYDSANDSWTLECWRSEDESLSQWFPNTDYPVEAGDEFVLLDIAMPGVYVLMAEQKLLTAARELLADTAVERFQYSPEIDAKFMVETGRTIEAGQNMVIVDGDMMGVEGEGGSYLLTSSGVYFLTSGGDRILLDDGATWRSIVDSVTINEGEAAIPTYKVTLRDRRRKTWTESEADPTTSSKPVSSAQETTQTSVAGDSFFELYTDGNGVQSVKLKSEYAGMWAEGFVSAGGIGDDEGGGGGGSVTSVGLVVPTGFSVSGSPVTSAGVITIGFANGYSLPTTAKQSEWDGKSVVAVTNLLTDPTYVRVATISVNGTSYDVKAPTSGGGTYVLPVASASVLGGVRIGSGLSIDPDTGILSASGGGSETDPIFTASPAYGITSSDISNWNSKTSNIGTITGINMNGASKGTSGVVDLGTVLTSHQSVTLTGGTNNGTLKLTTAAGTVDNIAVTGLGSLAYKSALVAGDVPDISGTYVTVATAQTVTGRKTFTNTIDANGGIAINSGSVLEQNSASTLVNQGHGPSKTLNLYGTSINLSARTAGGTTQANLLAVQSNAIVVESKITPNDVAGLDLGADSATKRWANIYGVNENLSGNLVMASTGHIDLGPVRLEFANGALHVTTNDSTNYPEIGFYADGFVSSGGVQSGASSFELSSNKVTSISSASTDTQYPSAKCVWDMVGDIESLLAAI